MQKLQRLVFLYWEMTLLRNCFYTVVFSLIVPTGGRFAYVTWKYGTGMDRFLVIFVGFVMGLTAAVTLLRFWKVAPKRTVDFPRSDLAPQADRPPSVSAILVSVAYRNCIEANVARNRDLAKSAAALGSTKRRRV